LSGRKSLRTDHDLPGNADQVGGREFRTRAFVEVVVERIDAPRLQSRVELFASGVCCRVALLQVEDRNPERRYAFGQMIPASS
jgi:hypothetical protein